VPVDGAVAGRAYATGQAYDSGSDGDVRIWLPLRDGTQHMGVVEVAPARLPSEPMREAYALLASVLAELVATRRLYGDAVERARRRLPMQLATEVNARCLTRSRSPRGLSTTEPSPTACSTPPPAPGTSSATSRSVRPNWATRHAVIHSGQEIERVSDRHRDRPRSTR
jgi:hypothetical protein